MNIKHKKLLKRTKLGIALASHTLILFIIIFSASLVSIISINNTTVSANAAQCEAAGGTPRLRQDSNTGEYNYSYCECPDNRTYYGARCITQSDLRIQLCEEDGGTARQTQNPSTGEYTFSSCECPEGTSPSGSGCVENQSDASNVNQEGVGGGVSLEADCETDAGEALNEENCGIIGYLVLFINVLSGLAGLAIVGSIVIAGYQYMTARDNAGQIQKARMRIIWALSALGIFIFMYALLNFLVPGGVL